MEENTLNLENSYWDLLKNLSADMKQKLIVRLSESLSSKSDNECTNLADKYYGAWKDNKSAEELNLMPKRRLD